MTGELFNALAAFAAGALTILSPCVLPLVPVVLASAAQRHRLGAFALAAGLVGSFTLAGFIVATFGSDLGLAPDRMRTTAALMLGAAGFFLAVPHLQDRVARFAGPLIGWAGAKQQVFDNGSLWGQAAIGVLLGLVWSPCVGPTLGAAIALAAEGRRLAYVAMTMASFATGIATVLLCVALLGRRLLLHWSRRLGLFARTARILFGATLLMVSALILSGLDRSIEARVLQAAPEWLVQWTTWI